MILRKSQLLATLAAAFLFAGCASPERLVAVPSSESLQANTGLGQVRYLVARETDTFAEEAMLALEKEKAWAAQQGLTTLPDAHLLAVSGGGDNGAFGAGVLNGWTESGTRPEFKIVTGVSTGALIAPFAFLGSKYDPALTKFYTTITEADIFKARGMLKGIFGEAMADTSPLKKLIAENVDQAMLDDIAAEYAKGRVLLVSTTNLDLLEPVIWNMTKIAASKDPRSLELFRSILRASASIPGAFPPVMIDVDVNGVRHQEMHVDGGTITQVFVYPPSIAAKMQMTPRKRTLYVLRNARFDSEWSEVPRKTMSIAARAIGSLTTTQGLGDLYRIYASAERDGIDFNLAFIPSTVKPHGKEQFNQTYMRELYATGKQMAEKGYPWLKAPPGFEKTLKADEDVAN